MVQEQSVESKPKKRVAILQSSYIPWKGYFDIINSVDEFILLDDVQYTRRDWRNRNLIKTDRGLHWLTIPVHVKGRFEQLICDTAISDPSWASKHWETMQQFYRRAKHFSRYQAVFAELYLGKVAQSLSVVNYDFLWAICQILGIKTKLSWSMDYHVSGSKTERLLALCKKAEATLYLSGPSAAEYLDTQLFAREGIEVEWMDYSGYPEYSQLYPPFEHRVSIVDLLLNEGEEAPRYMVSVHGRNRSYSRYL